MLVRKNNNNKKNNNKKKKQQKKKKTNNNNKTKANKKKKKKKKKKKQIQMYRAKSILNCYTMVSYEAISGHSTDKETVLNLSGQDAMTFLHF